MGGAKSSLREQLHPRTPLTRIDLLIWRYLTDIQRVIDGGFGNVLWLGAEQMLTGYDHLLFLFGVVLFLASFTRILAFVTAFTLGHTVTLLGATLLGVRANAYLIDSAIALSVIYVAVENHGIFKRWGVKTPNLIVMVFAFGLIHGFGLSTRFQEMTIATDPDIVSRILAFNIGVEFGQVIALLAMLCIVDIWRGTRLYSPVIRAMNVALLLAGFALFATQIHGYLTTAA